MLGKTEGLKKINGKNLEKFNNIYGKNYNLFIIKILVINLSKKTNFLKYFIK
jgi:hypothetical protein